MKFYAHLFYKMDLPHKMNKLIFWILLIISFNAFANNDDQKLSILGKNEIYTYIYDENTVVYNKQSDK